MPTILACVDGSDYTFSVCDHAGWFAGWMEASIALLCADEAETSDQEIRPLQPRRILDEASFRLAEHGLSPASSVVGEGALAGAVAKMNPDVVVMGKRGLSSEGDRKRLGSSVGDVVRSVDAPVCLTSQFFWSPTKVLVLADAEPSRRKALEVAKSLAGLERLPTDMIVVAAEGEDPEPKLQWARNELSDRDAQVFPIQAERLDDAVRRYMETRTADLIVISRAVLYRRQLGELARIEERSLWSWRSTILIC